MDTHSNLDKLYNLSNLNDITKGNQPLLRKLLEAFIRELSSSVPAIESSYKAYNLSGITMFAHNIKSNIDSLDVVSLKQVIRNIEADSKSGRHDRLDADIRLLKTISAQVIDQLKKQELS